MRYLAVDYGAKRTGLAICDEGETLASPLTVIEGQGGLVERIRRIITEEGVESVVLGLPVNMDGTDSAQTQRVRKLAEQWRQQLGIAVVLHDERLSSFEAEKKLAGLEITRKKKRKHVDAIAAAAILESFLEKKHQSLPSNSRVRPVIKRVSGSEELAAAAHELFVKSATEAISQGKRFRVAISGGRTPRGFFHLLGESAQSLSLRWESVEMFWVDERCVPPTSEASNYRLAASTFLEKVLIPAENVHRICGEYTDYARAVREYEQTIRRVFGLKPGQLPVFDLVVLGMGADGHIGSLFADSDALFNGEDIATAVYMTGGGYDRITMTYPVICAARSIMILVCGEEKAETLKDMFGSKPDHRRYPVGRLWPILHKVTWIVDKDAGRYV